MTPQQKIFKVIVLHNKLLAEDELDSLLATAPMPEQAIEKMVIAEMISEAVGQKLIALYSHNLKKQGIADGSDDGEGAGSPGDSPQPGVRAPHRTADREHAGDNNRSGNRNSDSGVYRAAKGSAEISAFEPARVPEPRQASAQQNRAPHQREPRPPQPRVNDSPARSPARAINVSSSLPSDGAGDIELVLTLLRTAREMRASDLHLISGAAPVLRIASVLHDLEMPPISPETVEASLMAMLTPAQREVFRTENDLDCSFDGGPGLGRFRLNLLRQHFGVDGVFRLVADQVPSFADLHLPEQCRKFTQYRQGIVLVTGPKGSGKTTTLAALIDLINSNRADHIITIEDPIEFVHPSKKGHVNQREVNVHTRTFANALRASLREAPDVIMVGEMRDLETVSLAITAAETGHLVFGTLHTPDAQRTVGRVIDVFPPREQGQIRAMFSESLRGVISQHLLPGLDGKSMHLATEVLFNTGAIANLIRDNRAFQIHGIMQTQKKMGMQLMDESLIRLVKEHKVAAEEALVRADNIPLVEKEIGVTMDSINAMH